MVTTRLQARNTRLILELRDRLRKQDKALDNYKVLCKKHEELQKRRSLARKRSKRQSTYNLTLRMSVLEGVIRMYAKYINLQDEAFMSDDSDDEL